MESGSFSERAEITPELEASYRDLFKDDFGDNVTEGHSPSIERPEDIRPEEGSLDERLDDLEKSYRDLFKDDFEEGENYDADVIAEANEEEDFGQPIQNKIDGLERENLVKKELEKKYPASQGYSVESEKYLRNENGEIVRDPETGEARRIDFVVIKGKEVVSSIEVTSKTADKSKQIAKENRIRENGGNFIETDNGNLIEIPDSVRTQIERRD